MKDEGDTKDELMNRLAELGKRIVKLGASGTERK